MRVSVSPSGRTPASYKTNQQESSAEASTKQGPGAPTLSARRGTPHQAYAHRTSWVANPWPTQGAGEPLPLLRWASSAGSARHSRPHFNTPCTRRRTRTPRPARRTCITRRSKHARSAAHHNRAGHSRACPINHAYQHTTQRARNQTGAQGGDARGGEQQKSRTSKGHTRNSAPSVQHFQHKAS